MKQPSRGSLVIVAGALSGLVLVPSPAASQAPPRAATAPPQTSTPRTPWGDPDLQGIYQNIAMSFVPFERPKQFGDRMYMTDEEYVKSGRDERSKEDQTKIREQNILNSIFPDILPPGEAPSRRTSMIVDPADGRFPALMPEAKKRDDAHAAAVKRRGNRADSMADIGLWSRCITRTLPGAWIPRGYNNYRQILQTPGYVMFYIEEIHEVRIIPLDGRPHIGPAIKGWMGDSRGHWEGDTLVIETTNFHDVMNFYGSGGGGERDDQFVGDKVRLIERLRRVDATTVDLEFTVYAPETYTKPWTVNLPLKLDTNGHDQILEYSCQEGSVHPLLMLRASRVEEKAEAEAAAKNKK